MGRPGACGWPGPGARGEGVGAPGGGGVLHTVLPQAVTRSPTATDSEPESNFKLNPPRRALEPASHIHGVRAAKGCRAPTGPRPRT